MLKVYYDAEFTGLHRNTTLISIGMVSELGSKFYAEFIDFDREQIDEWLNENVISNLKLVDDHVVTCENLEEIESIRRSTDVAKTPDEEIKELYNIEMMGNKNDIRHQLNLWLENESKISGQTIQMCVDCYAYDWMLLVDLLTDGGTAIEMDKMIHYIPIDLSTLLWAIGEDPDCSRTEFAKIIQAGEDKSQHNALFDAQVIKMCFESIAKSGTIMVVGKD